MPLGSDRPRRSEARIVVATNQRPRPPSRRRRFPQGSLLPALRPPGPHAAAARPQRGYPPCSSTSFSRRRPGPCDKGKPTAAQANSPTPVTNYHFPGNIRELQAMVFDAMSRAQEQDAVAWTSSSGPWTSRTRRPRQRLRPGPPSAGSVIRPAEPLPSIHGRADQLVAEAMSAPRATSPSPPSARRLPARP